MNPTHAPERIAPVLRRGCIALALAVCLPAAQAQSWGDNLLVNAGADAASGGDGSSSYAGNLPGWAVTGELMAVDYALGCPGGYPCTTDPGPADPGVNHFAGGNVALSTASQTVDLAFAGSSIQGTGAYYSLSGWLGGYASQNDYAQLSVSFLNAASEVVGTGSIGPVSAADRGNQTALLYREQSGWVPDGAVSAQVQLQMTRTGGTSNDGYADSLALSLKQANVLLSAPTTAVVGSQFDVTVAVPAPFGGSYSGDELLAFGYDLGFDSGLLGLTGVSVAGPWDDDSGFFADVDVAGSVFESILDEGQGTLQLATLSFEVLGTGTALIDVRSDAAGNLNEGLIYLNGESADLYGRTTVTLVPVPEPGQGLMLGAGLAALLGLRRRRGA